MGDSSIKKVEARHAPTGPQGQRYLVTGKGVSLRLWHETGPDDRKPEAARSYETVGYVIDGRAELHSEGQTVLLNPGDSWLVPSGARHTYRILEPFTAVEATRPPAHLHDRDQT